MDDERIGPYRLLSTIGRGGMGIIYRAARDGQSDPVALKVLPPELTRSAEFVSRFEREANLALRVSHPNLVRALDCGHAGGRLYYAMELVDGMRLSDVLEARGRLSEFPAIGIGYDIAGALTAIETLGLVHRDVHPGNILVTPDGVAKLMDFGLVKPVVGDLMDVTAPDMIVGTPQYMSPEQVAGAGELDIRTDVYSLGTTLYHAVTGRRPFDGKSPPEILRRIVKETAPDPRTLAPDLSEATSKLILRALARRREERFASAAKMRAAFDERVQKLGG
jgi:serine/threonine protein kinase